MSVASSTYVPASVARRALVAWSAYAVVAWIIALAALARWLWAVTLDGPVIYGEGAVAHAALLARDRLEYTVGARFGDVPPLFTAANYPPLYFHLAGLGDPFLVGRAISIVATVAVAAAIGWRARTGGALVAGALAAAWLASFPVAVWGAAVKPDLVALALTVGAVLALSAPRLADGPLVAGALLGLAVTAKPTAGLPALALAVAIVMRGDPLGFLRYVAAGVGAALAVGFATRLPDKAMYLHVVDWNALAWTPEQAVLLVLVAILTIGVPVLFALVLRAGPGPVLAYLAGAAAIVVLGGREGATINYLLDLAAAASCALAAIAPRLRASAIFPAVAAVQLVVAVVLLDPFGVVPGRAASTGAWSDPGRVALVRSLPSGLALVEDSGLLIATGREPAVDDLFLWSRLAERGDSFLEAERVLGAVRDRRFVVVVSETDLERIDTAPAYERQRWAGRLVRAVLEGYRLDRHEGALWTYVPR